MASLAEDSGVLNTTSQLQNINSSTLAANTLTSLIQNPERESLNSSLGLNGRRYMPLNKPFVMENVAAMTLKKEFSTYNLSSPTRDGEEESKDVESEDESMDDEDNVKQGISTRWFHIFPRPPGLKNYSNTCYMNSTLQALMHVPPLVMYLLSGAHGKQCMISLTSALELTLLGDGSVRQCVMCRLERHARDSYPLNPGLRQTILEPNGIVGENGGM